MGYQHPNLFLIGPPKCGTTSLYSYLNQHPQVFLSRIKEPNYFAYTGGNPYGWPTDNPYSTPEGYFSLFRESCAPVTGEASTCYSLMPHVADSIFQHNAESKIVAILRDPVKRAWSMYLYWLQFDKTCKHFSPREFRERFWADDMMTELERRSEKRVSWLRGAGLYWENLKHFYHKFPQQQILLLSYDRFATAPQECLSMLCNFLAIEDMAFDTTSKENVTIVPRFRRLYNFVNLETENEARMAAKNLFKRFNYASQVRRFANRLLMQFLAPTELPQIIARELRDFYRDDLLRLTENTGFDTRPWLK